ncbi:hypothetical protein [Nocardia sp. NPDC005745]|uniref:dioxygenase family protein n=1 Tax=Nocardia sp. NPDC005745 TaxID=3157061 RepID=UPI0033DD5669
MHPYRPARLHFSVEAEGFQAVATDAFVSDCGYVERDVVFSVRSELIRDFVVARGRRSGRAVRRHRTVRYVRFDFVLAPEER